MIDKKSGNVAYAGLAHYRAAPMVVGRKRLAGLSALTRRLKTAVRIRQEVGARQQIFLIFGRLNAPRTRESPYDLVTFQSVEAHQMEVLSPETEFEVANADLHLTEEGSRAVVMLATDKGPIALEMRRDVLEALVARAMSRLDATARF
jgi:hypothetical protein